MKKHGVAVLVAAVFSCVSALQASIIPTAGLAAWYAADSLVLTDGATVTAWTDSSVNGLDVTNAGSPIFHTNVLNGQPAISVGSGAYFYRTGVLGSNWGASGADIFLVMEQDGANPYNTAFGWGDPSGNNRFLVHATWGDRLYFQYGYPYYSSPLSEVSAPEPAGWDNAFHSVEGRKNGSTGDLIVDGSLLATASSLNSLDTSATATLFIANDTFGNNFQGQIAEIIVYDHALSSADHQTVMDYLDTKYDLSSVPEPAGWALGGSALAAILFLRRRSAA